MFLTIHKYNFVLFLLSNLTAIRNILTFTGIKMVINKNFDSLRVFRDIFVRLKWILIDII